MWFTTSLRGDDDDDGDDDGASNGFVMLHVTKGQIQNGSMLGCSLTSLTSEHFPGHSGRPAFMWKRFVFLFVFFFYPSGCIVCKGF